MYESRCGIACDSCDRKEEVGVQGLPQYGAAVLGRRMPGKVLL